jgi:hypothetical protein
LQYHQHETAAGAAPHRGLSVFHPPVALAGWPDEDRRSRIVFITRDIDRAALEASWRATASSSSGKDGHGRERRIVPPTPS